jgi:DNA repair protein RadA/Sms
VPYRCGECGWTSAKWVGRCGECQAWGSVEEVGAPTLRVTKPAVVRDAALPIGEVNVSAAAARPCGIDELDRVLGGGLVAGAVVLLAGEPGIGKSTLLIEAASAVATTDVGPVLYVTAEESAAQVRMRAERVGALHPALYLTAESDVATILGHVEALSPSLLIVDSVQTVSHADVDGAAGGVTQVREVAGALIRAAKARDMACVLVGHVTKDGSIAGPRVLEHLVDVVLQVEGERHSRLRIVRAVKNRYGPTDEVGCFDLGEAGMVGLADPSGLFLSTQGSPVSGTCVTVTLEGTRPLVTEVQALVAASALTSPRRTTSGLDSARVAMVLAVAQRRARVRLAEADVFAATVGGVSVREPAADVALLLAVASAATDQVVPRDLVAFGEVGLAGEVRPVSGLGRRLSEAARLGFTRALVPPRDNAAAAIALPDGMTVVEVADVRAAVRAAGLTGNHTTG